MTRLPYHNINKMMFVSHLVAYINDGLEIVEALDFRKTKMTPRCVYRLKQRMERTGT